MLLREILAKLDLGNSVAEFDAALEKYFVETQTLRMVVTDRADVVAGDKGTGKTALFRILQARKAQYSELRDVVILPAFNPSGSPVFQRLTEAEPLDEADYAAMWKTYVFALVGNWLLDQVGAKEKSKEVQVIERVLSLSELRSLDHTPTTVFGRIAEWVKRKLGRTTSAQVSVGIPKGPSVTPKLEFASDQAGQSIRYDEALTILNRALAAIGITCWVALDRLDEAFQSVPLVEIPALRALFRAFLDLMPFDRIRLKLFVRRDLFRKITQGGFVNLTHVNARKIEITWDEDDLKNLLCQRIRENPTFLGAISLERTASNDEIVGALFPQQVDPGERKPATWAWIMSRVGDGNLVKPPRNLIDLVKKAQEAETRREERESTSYTQGNPIIRSEALKKGLSKLSEERVNDTLLAEAGDLSQWIEKFRDAKAEHNEATLAATLGVPPEQVTKIAKALAEIGFLEQVGENYKVPMLYRDGMNITQGKAF